MFEMLLIDIGDDGDRRRQPQEGSVRSIRLHDHPVAFADTRIRSIGVDDAAIDYG
ncbi:MAG: hypothetical protein R3C42_09140 [Parvularculaceae bacterium]